MADILIIRPVSCGNNASEIEELINRTGLKGLSLERIKDLVNDLWVRIRKGIPLCDLHAPLEMEGLEASARHILIDVARTRKRSREKFENGASLFFTSEGLRWATPGSAADHCSKRLAREMVMDISCGQGGQILSLSRNCKEVIGIDIDPLNCLLGILNCSATGVENVCMVHGNCMHPESVEMAKPGCAVFSDPARPPTSTERTLDEIVPDPRMLMEVYGEITGGMCFEVPPYISLEQVDFPCEAEYVSLEGRLNRLNLYTGDLIRDERSSVVLPDGERIGGVPGPYRKMKETEIRTGDLIYEVDPSVVKAGLQNELGEVIGIPVFFLEMDERRTMMTAGEKITSPFLKSGYRVLATGVQEEDILPALRKVGAGRVTLRYEIDPIEYWNTRNSIQSELDGKRKVHLFKGRVFLVLEKLHEVT